MASKPSSLTAAADAAFDYGVWFSSAGDPVGAARGFARATALRPSHALAWTNLGVVLQQAGRNPVR